MLLREIFCLSKFLSHFAGITDNFVKVKLPSFVLWLLMDETIQPRFQGLADSGRIMRGKNASADGHAPCASFEHFFQIVRVNSSKGKPRNLGCLADRTH